MSKQIRQFKLTNNDEVICEVLEWDTEDNAAILVKGALRILNFDDFSKGVRLFAFRPWMGMQDDPDIFLTINAAHIVGETSPSENIIKHYAKTVNSIKTMVEEKKYPNLNMDKVLQEIPIDATDEEFDEILEDIIKKEGNHTLRDSDESNIIKFKPKGTLH